MKNNKGFTIIEVAVSFVLVATISIVLLQLVLSLKEVYLTGDVKTTLLNKQGIMTKYIYDDLDNKDLASITSCGLSCLTFTYTDSTVKNLLVDPGNKTISYGDYTLQIDNSSYFDNLGVDMYQSQTIALNGVDDSVIAINIPILSKLLDKEDFGIHVVKTYNSGATTINIDSTLENTPVTVGGINTNLTVIDGENNTINGMFAKVLHQSKDHYFNNATTDSGYKDFIKNSNADTFSVLGSLEAFKSNNGKLDIINSLKETIDNDTSLSNSAKAKAKAEINNGYQNGYYSLLLNYNNIALSTGNYYWWYQTNNIASKEKLNGFYVDFENGLAPNGLTYNKTGDSWSNIVGQTTNLGVKTGNIYDFKGNVADSVDLYVEAREYVCKYSLSNVTYNGGNIKALTMSDGTKLCPTES